MIDWRPTTALSTLEKRAALLDRTRAFFAGEGVLEVDVPVLGEAGVTDPHIDNIEVRNGDSAAYLQSSPEYYLKRLIAAGAGPLYYLGKAFRGGERGRFHNPEFTLLEWYRPGWDERRLMAEVTALFEFLDSTIGAPTSVTYRELFFGSVGLDPHRALLSELRRLAGDIAGADWSAEGRSACLDLIFSHRVEPAMPGGLVFVHDYPECQAALAKLDQDRTGDTVARRFELFLDCLELGNGYFELTDAGEQRRRFQADNSLRKQAGKPVRAVDGKLLAALDERLPDCAGVAIGFDRLVMRLLGIDDIRRVIAFDR